MKRRIIKQGHNTLTVTLPSKWVASHGVKPGNEVEITEQDNALVISTSGNGMASSSITLDISGLSAPLIWRYISSAYRAGYDEIAVTGIGSGKKALYSAFSYNTLEYLKDGSHSQTSSLDMSPMETVSAVVNRLIGVEIIDQKPDYCLIKDLSDVSDKEFENALRRIFILVQTEADNIREGFTGKPEGLKSIHIVDTNLDRFEDFCFRVLNKKGYSTLRKTSIMHSLIFTLEMIGDELKKIAIHMLDNKGSYTQAVKELFDVQVQQIQHFYKLFYKFDKQLAVDIYEADRKGSELIEKLRPKLSSFERDELLHHFKKIGIYVLSLTELSIDMMF